MYQLSCGSNNGLGTNVPPNLSLLKQVNWLLYNQIGANLRTHAVNHDDYRIRFWAFRESLAAYSDVDVIQVSRKVNFWRPEH